MSEKKETPILKAEHLTKMFPVKKRKLIEKQRYVHAAEDVSFEVYPGEVLGIVGESGSGKSTAVQLLAGTLVGYEGDVLLSEMPSGMRDEVLGAMLSSAAPDDSETLKSHQIRDLTAASLTREISIVSAHSHLFAGTLRDNLLMARADATDNELWQTLEAAHIDDFVRAQSRGLDMPITQDGANLSGGQKQRLCIARALLASAKILIFDDSTSAVDTATEKKIRKELEKLGDVTKIIIAQRISSVIHTDRIVILDDGKIHNIGTHEQLLKEDAIYQEIYASQMKGGNSDGIENEEC